MNKKIKTTVIAAAILGLLALIWFFAADYLFAFILSKIFPPGPPAPTTQLLPCDGNPASQVELGYPHEGGPVAEFVTSGEPIYVIARRFEHSGIFGSFRGSTAINIGNVAILPSYDERRNTITNSFKNISIKEKDFGEVDLPAGRYWLWSSAGGDIVVYSCDPNGVSDPKPVK